MHWAIDPGVQKSALAIGSGWAGVLRLQGLQWIHRGERHVWEPVQHLTIEKPKIYPGMPGVDANDLIDLGETVGWLRREIVSATELVVYPADWKGQVSKPIHHDRIWANMNEVERALFPVGTYERIQRGLDGKPYKSEVHNLLDAVGLLFFGAGRLGRGGTRIR